MVTYTPRHSDFCPISKTPCPGFCIYADILEGINLGIMVFDLNAERVIFQNKLAVNLFKETTEPKDYQPLYQLLLLDAEGQLDSVPSTFSHTLHFGNQLFGYTAYKIIEGFVWVFIQDITAKNRLESVAQTVNTMENLGYIFSCIRHELGNPINSVKMTLSVLKNNLDKYSPETVKEYIDRIQKEIGRVEYLLKSMKNFNMYERPQPQKVDLVAFMEEFLFLMTDYFQSQGIEVKTLVSPGTRWGYIDPRAFQQVMLNLLSNAAESMDGRAEPEIIVYMHKVLDRVWINIADNGCGMSEEQQKNLFKPFYTSKPQGTGLGLVIVKKMLAKMDSTIEIKSFEKAGTLVTISIPESGEDDSLQ